jgi:hypothetical protein
MTCLGWQWSGLYPHYRGRCLILEGGWIWRAPEANDPYIRQASCND